MFIMNSRFACLCLIVLLNLIAPGRSFSKAKDASRHASIGNVEENSSAINEDNEEDENKFSWKHHPDEHSVYSHRSLMSTTNIRYHNEEPDDESPTTRRSDANDYEALKTVDYAEKEWNLMFRALDSMSDGFASSMLHQIGKQTNLLEEIISRLKPECQREINHIKESVKKHKLWALRMVDSNGKLPSGVSYGRFSSPGDYEECLAVNVDESVYKGAEAKIPEHHKFHGKYCLLDFRLPMPPRPRDRLLSIHEPVLDLSNTELASAFPEIKNYSAYASVFYEVGYLHAFCLPSTCDVEDLMKSLSFVLEGLHIIVNNTVDCEVNYEGKVVEWTRPQIISMTLMVLLFLNAIIASIAHYLQPQKHSEIHRGLGETAEARKFNEAHQTDSKLKSWAVKKSTQNRLYSECFSIQKNFERLTKPDPRGLTFVHYTRIVAMALTVITHTAGMGTLQAITKPADASNSEQIFRDFLPQMLANAFSSIQIFFFMAGFMLVISTYPAIKRDKGHMSFVEYAIKRAIRLMPGLAATIGLNFLWPLVVDGPMLTYFTRVIVEPCATNWWRTMAFLSNFDHVEKMCLRHSYFSASDYQLHVMAFPLLILLYKQPTLSLVIAGLLTILGFAAQVIMVLTKTVMPFILVDYIDKEAFFNVVHYIHHPVWNHMSAFFYGFIMGYFVVKQIRINLSKKTISRIWLVVIPAGFLSVYAPYFWNHYKRPIHKWQMILYILIDRFILLTTCAWLSYATMVLGRKKPTDKSAESKKANLNLPNILTMSETQKNPQDPSVNDSVDFTQKPVDPVATTPTIVVPDEQQANRLTTSPSTGSIPRQRSSPNFLSSAGDDKLGGLRPAISSVNMSALVGGQQQQSAPHNDPSPQGGALQATSLRPGNKPRAPVSNLNTLCLILSRLTFQLYLFNMVVLWVDVNHSKYFWFFSYYFIITKAMAVYIASSLMAMVFFVTLESPCLTLYIMWVKSRAQARANRRMNNAEKPDPEVMKDVTNITNIDVYSNFKDRGMSPLKQSKLGGGLQMRLGSPQGITKPSFSFIDLSSPPASAQPEQESHLRADDQTKM